MEICVKDEEKLVEIWLTKDEKADAALRESLQPLYARYKGSKYKVAVFCSGGGSLYDGTERLLLHNRTVFAKRDIEEDEGFSMTMGM